jgi:Sucrase/ferredoxin-like
MPDQPPVADPFHGSAPESARSWLLIEHPGPWPAFGPPAGLPAALAEYADRALGHGVRTQLIRRTDRGGRLGYGEPDRMGGAEGPGVSQTPAETAAGQAAGPSIGAGTGPGERAATSAARATRLSPVRAWNERRMRVLLAGGPAESRWLIRLEPAALRSLPQVDPARFAEPAPPLPGASEDAALLVCTHGRREVCCAQYGRPVARALAAEFGPLVWETTHVGGDEFAANLVVLPTGAYFGRLLPSEAVALARRALRGDLDPNHYRGTAGQPAPVQLADCLLRRTILLAPDPAGNRAGTGAQAGVGAVGGSVPQTAAW